jgi:hypothetical protein
MEEKRNYVETGVPFWFYDNKTPKGTRSNDTELDKEIRLFYDDINYPTIYSPSKQKDSN